jgi:hypothetical protein
MPDEPDIDEYAMHKIPRSRKIWYAFSTVVIIFAAGFILLVIFWMVFPYKTAEIKQPVPVLNENNEVAIGDNLELKVSVTKYSDAFPNRTEIITCDDGSITFVDPGRTSNFPPGTYEFVNDSNVIPDKLIPGATCMYHFRYTYRVNPVREIVKEWDSEPFLVLPRRA